MNHPEQEINTVWRSDAKVGPGGFVQKRSHGWFREVLLLVPAESNPAPLGSLGNGAAESHQTGQSRICAPQEINLRVPSVWTGEGGPGCSSGGGRRMSLMEAGTRVVRD